MREVHKQTFGVECYIDGKKQTKIVMAYSGVDAIRRLTKILRSKEAQNGN